MHSFACQLQSACKHWQLPRAGRLKHTNPRPAAAASAVARAQHVDRFGVMCRIGADGKHDLSYLPWHHGTPLIGAAAAGHADVCKALLDKGAKKDAKEQVGRAPCRVTCVCGLRERM